MPSRRRVAKNGITGTRRSGLDDVADWCAHFVGRAADTSRIDYQAAIFEPDETRNVRVRTKNDRPVDAARCRFDLAGRRWPETVVGTETVQPERVVARRVAMAEECGISEHCRRRHSSQVFDMPEIELPEVATVGSAAITPHLYHSAILVARNRKHVAHRQDFGSTARSQRSAQVIAKIYNFVDTAKSNVIQDCFEREVVAVDVGNGGEFHIVPPVAQDAFTNRDGGATCCLGVRLAINV